MTEPTVEQLREWAATKVMGFSDVVGKNDWKLPYGTVWIPPRFINGTVTYRHGAGCTNWQPDKNRDQLAQVVMKWCGEYLQRWNAVYEKVTELAEDTKLDYSWQREANEFKLYFTNPELVLRALYQVMNAQL